jgi:GNAT superfamily N-acetyltransferase
METTLREAELRDVETIIIMVRCLFEEIIDRTERTSLPLSIDKGIDLLKCWMVGGQYTVLLAEVEGQVVGCLSLVASIALYMEGPFGVVPELFVRPQWRSMGIGRQLLEEADKLAAKRGWRCLEVTTPPLPEFDRTLAFYHGCGFEIAGGRKMRRIVGEGACQ